MNFLHRCFFFRIFIVIIIILFIYLLMAEAKHAFMVLVVSGLLKAPLNI